MRVLLWDVDGTLIRGTGAGVQALGAALGGHPGGMGALRGMRLDGMTDWAIARLLCGARRHHHAPQDSLEQHAAQVSADEISALLDGYLTALEELLKTQVGYHTLPGVEDVLDKLGRMPHLTHALGTGNIERGAQLKLGSLNLWSRFAFGGFAGDGEERADILRAAHRRAQTHLGQPVAEQHVLVVGDTPRDVAAAHVVGMRVMGVATGRYTAHQLAQAGADDVLNSLEQADAWLRILALAER